jgi:TonB-linked SusC/RagA family outer membrane protein
MKKVSVLIMFLAFLGLQLVQAQTRQITGTVTSSADGTTIPGVQIVVVGSTIGTTTDIDGKYSLNVPESATQLQFTFVGMETMVVDISGRTTISVEMNEDLQALGEVIVLGYSTRGKNQITGSTVQVTAEELRDIPVTSVDQALQGKVAGLTINAASGTPGAIQDIRIRGVSSIQASNDPLFVIDGVPVIQTEVTGSSAFSSLSSLAAINSQDIESITVLKDASATSAYGARGSNGVIVITTVKGKAGATKFNFNANYGFQNRATTGRVALTAAQGEELYLEAVLNSFGAANGLVTPDDAYNYAVANGLNYISRYVDWRADGRPEENWGTATENANAPVYNVTLSATGGDDVSSFYASMGINHTEAIVVGNVFDRINAQLNYNRNMSKRVRFSTTNTFSYTDQTQPFLETSAYYGNPHMARYFMSPTIMARHPDGSPNIDYNAAAFNVLYLMEKNDAWNHMTRILSNSFLEVDLIKDLKFKTLAGFDYVMGSFKDYRNRHHGDGLSVNGASSLRNDQEVNMVFQNSLTYKLNLLDNHRFDFMALMEYQEYRNWYLYGYGNNFITDGLTNINSAGANYSANSTYSQWSNLSYLGMVNYSYLGKYIVDLTFRREGSSRFAADERWGNFWAVGAAWNLSQESFFAGVTLFDNLRVRGSYGVSGNNGVSSTAFMSLLSFSGQYAGAGTIVPQGFGNPVLTWEKNRNYDIGIDFAILNNRIDGQVNYYNKTTFDLLQGVPLTRTSGFTSITTNVGEMVTKGFEGVLNFDIVRSSDFNFSINANFATLNNEVTELAKDPNGEYLEINGATTSIAVGHTYNEWYMREWAGVNPDNGRPQWYVNEPDADGNIIDPDAVTETYGDAYQAYQGKSAIPTFTGGTGFHVDFKGVYLDANFYIVGGNMIEEQWDHYMWDSGWNSWGLFNGYQELMTRWQQPGDVTDVPQVRFQSRPYNNTDTSTRQLYNGDYVRLKDMVLGYNIPSSLTSKVSISGASVYVRGTNLWTFVFDERLKTGYDPETRADGYTGLETPPIKSIIFGININF